MKLLVFAHTPPPYHGQSQMVKLMLDGLGGDCRTKPCRVESRKWEANIPADAALRGQSPTFDGIECYHVNTRYSADIGDMGAIRVAKLFLVFRYCLEAIWCRFHYGIRTFYFAPAPPKWPALYRDWLVMLMCRPFFPRIVHHWHALGVEHWLKIEGTWFSRRMTRWLLGKPSLGIALATANLRDPLWLEAKRVAIVPNGIPDPFPDFCEMVLPRRTARLDARRRLLRGERPDQVVNDATGTDPQVFRILYLGSCFRQKGIFETLEGVARAEATLRAQTSALRIHLTVAGDFNSAHEREEFADRISQPDLAGIITYSGFVESEDKRRLLIESDCLCFPTYCDSFGLVVLEAMAIGLNVIATNWGALPEILPPNFVGFVPVKDAQAIAERIPLLFSEDSSALRGLFLERFTERRHLQQLHDALRSLESVPAAQATADWSVR